MEKNKAKTLPRSKSVKELVDFFETHDMGDYWEKMPKAHFDVTIKKRKHLVALEKDIPGTCFEKDRGKREGRLYSRRLSEKKSEDYFLRLMPSPVTVRGQATF